MVMKQMRLLMNLNLWAFYIIFQVIIILTLSCFTIAHWIQTFMHAFPHLKWNFTAPPLMKKETDCGIKNLVVISALCSVDSICWKTDQSWRNQCPSHSGGFKWPWGRARSNWVRIFRIWHINDFCRNLSLYNSFSRQPDYRNRKVGKEMNN